MTTPNKSLREEFEHALDEAKKVTLEKYGLPSRLMDDKWIALWGAKWAMERCIKEIKDKCGCECNCEFYDAQEFIREILKELQ